MFSAGDSVADLSQGAEVGALLEREGALELIAQGVGETLGGGGRAVLLHGRHGVGKSSLLAVAAAMAKRKGVTVLGATGRELERGFDFGVVLQLFEPALERGEKQGRSRLLAGPARGAITVFSPGPPAQSDSFEALHGLFWLTAHIARRGPLMLAVDDVDLADVGSLRFLLYLIERLRPIPLLVIVSSGSGMRASDPDLVRRLEQNPLVERCVLEPLSMTATARCFRRSFPDADDDVCRSVHEATRGNPWLVHELAAAGGGRTPTVAEVSVAAPPSVAERVQHRAGALGPDGPILLSVASVLGDGAEPWHAAELAGLDRPHAQRVVDELVAGGLLAPGDRISFIQPMVRRALVRRLAAGRRSELHLRAAELLAAQEAGAKRVAGHLMHATRAANDWVAEVLTDAATQAMADGAPGSAVAYLRRALDEPPRADQRARISIELGRAEATAGDAEAVGHLLGAMKAVSDPRERAEIALDAGQMLLALGRQADAVEAFRSGLRELDEPTDVLFGRLSAALRAVLLLWPTREGERGAFLGGEPPRGTDAPDDRWLLAQLALRAALRGDPHERATELATRALNRGALLTDETADGIAYYMACEALTIAEELALAEGALTAAVEDGAARGSVLGTATAHFFRSLARLRRGDVHETAADARQALDAERYGWRFADSAARAVLAEALTEIGKVDEARRCLEAAAAAAGEDVAARVAVTASRAHLAELTGNPEQALVDFLQCGQLLQRMDVGNPAVVAWRSGAARALAALGDRDEARRLVESELTLAEAFGAPGVIGRSLRALGAVEDGMRVLEALESAVEHLERSRAALERARALVDFGAALRRSGRRRAAREPLRRGLDLARRVGANTLVRRATVEARAAGTRPRRTALKGREALTPREEQVAALAAGTKSNREIAEELVVTVKTVEWHLQHTFRKLGIESRRELHAALHAEDEERASQHGSLSA